MSAPHPTVLLVDDVADLRMLTRLVLTGSGRYEVVAEAGDGIEAIEAAGFHQPDVVLLDAAMPRMDGLEALGRILGVAPSTSVVMVSAFGVDRLGEEARRRGAVGYIEKGASPEALLTQLDEILGNDRSTPATPLGLHDDSMLDVIAHDLRTPISVISGFVAVLDQQWDSFEDADRRRLLRRIGVQSRMAEMLTTNLLSSDGRIDRLVRRRTAVDVAEALTDLAEALDDVADAVPVRRRVPDDIGHVVGDEAALAHVLCNLVSNAARHAVGTPSIEIEAERRGDEVVVSVIDHGPGIPPDQRSSVFDRHVRLGDDGLGLGLHSCSLFVAALGGRIWVDETPGGGATFRVALRVASEAHHA